MHVFVRAAVFAVLAGGVTAVPATAEPPPDTVTPGKATPGKATTVTLVTGDQVTVRRQGPSWDVRIRPAARIGAPEGFLHHAGPGGVTVIPASAAPLIRSGQLDRALFDVTRLIELGYDDEHTPAIPLLVESRDAKAASGVAALGTVTRSLPTAGLTAVSTPKNGAASAFQLVKNHKVWLNGKAFPTLEQSVPQVGAPAAWQAGHTGAGAKIAVLDTGYDPGHPDLAGIVKGEKDFTGEGIRDTRGHGTHVASITAGRGTASGGKYTGVAKGADLLIGKVCAVDGCPFDVILDGMQWAADNGAKVVNMSLGGGSSDGTGLLDLAVNRISAEKGTLFVIAAGNGAPGKVSTPAAADAALAVASVTKQDVRSTFSSPGPRIGDYAVKPDIAAPGEDITAARAKDTDNGSAVNEFYTKLSGTSMAAPHVAGAAAIVTAQHPDWTGQQIKTALMGSAHPVADATVYQQGTGRLDVARAVSQTVTANAGSLSLGLIKWSEPGTVLSKPLTYKNSGTAPVTLALSSSDAAFRVSAPEVTVPAGGEATVTVSFDGSHAAHASYGGLVLAKSGSTEVRTAVGATREPESYDVTLHAIDRDGNASPDALTSIHSLDSPEVMFIAGPDSPIRIPAGRYAAISSVFTSGANRSITLVTQPDILVKASMTIELDARLGVPVSTSVDRADAHLSDRLAGQLFKVGDSFTGSLTWAPSLYAVPTSGKYDHFMYFDSASFEQKPVTLSVAAPEQFEPMVDWLPRSPKIIGTREMSSVDAVRARSEDLAQRDVRGKLAVFTLSAGEEDQLIPRLRALRDAGATAAFFYFSDSGSVPLPEDLPLPTLSARDDQGPRLAKLGTATVRLSGIAASAYHYELTYPSHGSVPASLTHKARTQDLAEVRATYRAVGPSANVAADPFAAGFPIYGGGGPPIPLPTVRTEYYTPDTVTWQKTTTVDRQYTNRGEEKVYRRGPATTEDWFKAVIGPGQGQLTRTGDKLTVDLPLFTDAARHIDLITDSDQGDTVLYADGEEVGRSGKPGRGEFTVPGDAARYRLATEATRASPAWRLSTKVTAEWEFASARTGPLPSVVLDPKVDTTNTGPAGMYTAIPVRPGKDGVVNRVDVSTDDGTTWRPAALVRVRDQWWAVVWNPADGFVSLRAQASYPDGTGVTQTAVRAYQVK